MTEEKAIYKTLWTVSELAKEAGITTGAIRQMLLAGKIDGQKLGVYWVITDSVAQEWLKSRQSRRGKK